MKIKQLLVLCVMATLISCGKSAITNTKIENATDSLSYVLGVNIYSTFMQDSLKLNPAAIAKAILDAEAGKALMDDNECRNYYYAFMNKREQEKASRLYKKNIQQGIDPATGGIPEGEFVHHLAEGRVKKINDIFSSSFKIKS